MLEVNAGVQAQLGLNLIDVSWISFKDVVHVVTTVEVTCVVGELASAELLDLCSSLFYVKRLVGFLGIKGVGCCLDPFGKRKLNGFSGSCKRVF